MDVKQRPADNSNLGPFAAYYRDLLCKFQEHARLSAGASLPDAGVNTYNSETSIVFSLDEIDDLLSLQLAALDGRIVLDQ